MTNEQVFAEPIPSATVVWWAEDGRVLLLQKASQTPFLPGHWVFPGGRVEQADHLAGRSLGGDGPTRVAALRESMEEAGLPAEPWREGEALPDAWRPLLEQMVPFSRWVTPHMPGRRYDTLFYVLRCPPDLTVQVDGHEIVDAHWVDPQAVLAEGPQHWPMVPPTLCVLRELSRDPRLSLQRARDLRPILPVLDRGAGRYGVFLPGHPRHPMTAIAGLPVRVAIRTDRWDFEDSDLG